MRLANTGLMHVKLYEDIARHGHIATTYAYPVKVNERYVMDPSPTPKFDNPKMDDCAALQLFGAGREKRIYAIPPHTKVTSLDFEDHPFETYRFDAPCALCGSNTSYLDEVVVDDKGGRMFVCSDTDYCETAPRGRPSGRRLRRRSSGDVMRDDDQPLLVCEGLSKSYGRQLACKNVSFQLYPGEVLAIVGESGSGKSTLLQMLSTQLQPSAGRVSYRMRDGIIRDLASLGEAERRFLFRTDWGYVHQDPAMGLRMAVSAGANVGERLMAVGWGHYGKIRQDVVVVAGAGRDFNRPHRRCAEKPIPAACGSACRLRAISSPSRVSCSWMSPPADSMFPCRRGCSIWCAGWSTSSGSR